MSKGSILICDDCEAIYNSLYRYFERNDIEVLSVSDGESALKVLDSKPVDIVLLDVMMPGIDGFEVCERIRQTNKSIYIVMLSAKIEESDRILGLELGADDYIAKPFSPREVSVKLTKIIERLYPDQSERRLTFQNLTVYPDSSQFFVDDREITLSPKEAAVLIYMVTHSGKIVGREQILNAVWGYDYFGDTRVVDTIIKTLRQKILSDNASFAIRTIYGSGYKLEEKIR